MINIPDMTEILHAHGLKIVPIDVNLETLQFDYKSIFSSVSDRTVMIVVAHLFGAIMNIEKLFELKKADQISLFLRIVLRLFWFR